MKNKLFRITVSLFLFICSFLVAQFNTLTPIQPQKSETQKFSESNKEDFETKQSHEKKSWISIFNSNTKGKLKNELDSLKTLLKNQEINQQKKEQKRKTDSLISRIKVLETAQRKIEFDKANPSNISIETIKEYQNSNSKIVMPLMGEIAVTSPFGTRIHPIFGTRKSHNGIDLKANYENVYSVLDGIVTATGWDAKGGGNFIKINHYHHFETSYLHLSEIYYKVGEEIKAGFVIAKSGNSGNSTGPHLHFGVKEFGQNINPIHFLNDLNKAKNLITNYYEH